jgi:hypothetical protein
MSGKIAIQAANNRAAGTARALLCSRAVRGLEWPIAAVREPGSLVAASMSSASTPAAPIEQTLEIDLRDPHFAALLAWLWPGAGHLYQRRYAKGILFMACILATYFFGLALGEGKVVYASWNQVDKRWQYPLQLGVGVPAAPALVQSVVARRGNPPILGGFMAAPAHADQLADWHKRLNMRFELGTLYTMVAGLLNILAIWDAWGGPVLSEPGKQERGPPGDDKDKKDKNKPQ